VIVADEDTRLMNVVLSYPVTGGSLNEWTGGYDVVDESDINDADYSCVNENDKANRMAVSNITYPRFRPLMLKIGARAQRTVGSAVSRLRLGVRESSSSDLDAGQVVSEGAWANLERYATTINGSAISSTVLDAMEHELRSLT
jgi:hypothetical protein